MNAHEESNGDERSAITSISFNLGLELLDDGFGQLLARQSHVDRRDAASPNKSNKVRVLNSLQSLFVLQVGNDLFVQCAYISDWYRTEDQASERTSSLLS